MVWLRATVTVVAVGEDDSEEVTKTAEFSLLELQQRYPDTTSDDFERLITREAVRLATSPILKHEEDGLTVYPPSSIRYVRVTVNPLAQEGMAS